MSDVKIIYDWSNVKEATKVIAGVRQAAFKEAASAVCTECGKGKEVKLVKEGWSNGLGGFYHRYCDGDSYTSYCIATPIHLLLAADQGQGQGKE